MEIVGGILTNSVAIISGAVHDLGDSLSLRLAWHLDKYAEKERDRWYSYGYRRFSLLGALATTFGMTVGGVAELSQAIPRLLRPEYRKAEGMALLAVAGTIVTRDISLRKLRVQGGGTTFIKLHSRVRYRKEDIDSWLSRAPVLNFNQRVHDEVR